MDFQHRSIFIPFVEVIANGTGGRKVARDQAPLAAGSILIHQCIDNASQIDLTWSTGALLFWNNRFNKRPLCVSQVGRVTHRNTWFLVCQYTNQSWYHNG